MNCPLVFDLKTKMQMPDQREIKILTRDVLKHGDILKLANFYGITESAMGQRLNPNLDTPSNIYRALYDLRAIIFVNKTAARKLWLYVSDVVNAWLGDEESAKPDTLLGDISTDFSELLKARLSHKPTHLQRKEALQLQAEVTRFVESLEPDNVTELRA
jgi:hypothetical protein